MRRTVTPSGGPSPPFRPAHVLGAAACVGALAAALSLSYVARFGHLQGSTEPATVAGSWPMIFLVNLVYWLTWGVLAPAAGRASRRFPLAGPGWRRRVPGHLVVGTAIAVVHVLVVASVLTWLRPDAPPFLERAEGIFFRIFDWELVTYGALVGLWHAAEHHARAREREQAAARLERELIGAQLQVLQRQLQPHFVLNALQRILPVVERDAAGASGMLLHLGELLRATVKSLGSQEVTLGEEIAFVRRYLEFQPPSVAARVSIDVPAGLERLLVPNLAVQGLVENALKYGVDPRRPGSGRVTVRAFLAGPRLALEVEDDGPGLRPAADGAGTGLSNLAARLEHLYAGDHALSLDTPPAGGLRARVEIPPRAAGEEPSREVANRERRLTLHRGAGL